MSETIPGILPLSKVVSIYESNKDILSKDLLKEPLASLPAAFYVTLHTLSNVYHSSDPKWLQVRERVLVSFIKETKTPKEMNSSVTSGIIAQMKNPPPVMAILNCGTGPVKYQIYAVENGVAVVLSEHKPKTGPSISDLNIPGVYKGKTEIAEIKTSIIQDIAECQKKLSKDCTFSAVITGDIRTAYYKLGDLHLREPFDTAVKTLFEPFHISPWNGHCYFISQEEEGSCEVSAVKNLHKGIDPRLQVLFSFGIGRGSCQWSHEKLVVGNTDGMNRPDLMLGMADVVAQKFKTPEYVSLIVESLLPNSLPVISLKSGTTLHFYNEPSLQKLFGI
jgi:hypothetical protein